MNKNQYRIRYRNKAREDDLEKLEGPYRRATLAAIRKPSVGGAINSVCYINLTSLLTVNVTNVINHL